MLFDNGFRISDHYESTANAVLYQGDCLDFLDQLPDGAAQLIVTSPPYNIGKSYEKRRHWPTTSKASAA